MADYRVNLDIFAGPLDLLLYLVRKEEVDIYDISIAKITDQYVHYLELLKNLDIDVASSFLVMAATLMHIKSAMLLPKAEPEQIGDDELGDPRTELIRQLLEYKKFKDAANLLYSAADEQKMRFARPSTIVDKLKPNAEPEIDIEQVSTWDLLEAFDTICKSIGSYGDISHIKDDTPIDLYQIEILHHLQEDGPASFEKIFESKTNRAVMVGLFLALLELIREKLIWIEQSKPLGAIYLRSLTDEPAEQAVRKAILSETERKAAIESQPALSETDKGLSSETQQQERPSIPLVELPPKSKSKASADKKEQIEPLQRP